MNKLKIEGPENEPLWTMENQFYYEHLQRRQQEINEQQLTNYKQSKIKHNGNLSNQQQHTQGVNPSRKLHRKVLQHDSNRNGF